MLARQQGEKEEADNEFSWQCFLLGVWLAWK
jgi:hypothetical protein